MKKMIKFIIVVGLISLIYIYRDNIGYFVYKEFILEDIVVTEFVPNEYYRENNYNYVQITNDFEAKNKQHLLNIYYTIVNSGANTFTFKCSEEYEECLNDVAKLSNDQAVLSNINSFVHPFNGFSSVETQYDNLGKVILSINKAYTDEEINLIKSKVENIVISNVKITNTDKRAIIKIIHDYVIKTTKYDSNRSDNKIVNYKSDIAYGPLFEGYGLCGGYTDTMALFLDYYNIPNFKVISENHIWNAVYLDGKWYHLDLTWDDPISKSGKDILEYTFFLIDTDNLLNIEKEQHTFNQEVFVEISQKNRS